MFYDQMKGMALSLKNKAKAAKGMAKGMKERAAGVSRAKAISRPGLNASRVSPKMTPGQMAAQLKADLKKKKAKTIR